ncbi:MAG: ATP synthase F1 subunit gamma [Rickettsiaceae bacterium]|nr:ATP synthase F1 subunit gamma [Rickettsiaceae bacterium]
MSNVKALRNRIKSVKSTQKITKAMRMVAASKLNKAKNSAKFASAYREKIQSLFGALKNTEEEVTGLLSSAILSKRDSFKSSIIIIYGSDRGLCGPFNSNIFKKLKGEIDKYPQPKIITIGKKIDQIITKIAKSDFHLSASTDAMEISARLIEFIENNLKSEPSCQIVSYYTIFKNTLTLIPSCARIAPMENSEQNLSSSSSVEFEGANLMEKLCKSFIESNIIANLYESKASSEASCMTAMDSATRNAGSMIQNLTLKMNRTRQAIITNELIEVIAGAEAI